MAATKPISLKILVHKDRNQVIYAESGKDFVDVLFSFLTMPMGTIVRLAGKQSKIGCMSTLYEAVKDLNPQFLQTEACKHMLLHPSNASEKWLKNLRVNIDDTKPSEYYTCSWRCCVEIHHLTSTANTSRCLCGDLMNMKLSKRKSEVAGWKSEVAACEEKEAFLKGNMRFMIRDDLYVSPISIAASFTLLNKLGITDMTALEERNVNVGEEEVLHLLRCLLLSKTPLTDVFLRDGGTITGVDLDFKVMSLDSKDMSQSLTEKESGSDSKKMNVKLLLSKSNNKVLYAESDKDFPDLLFSFVAFPLGSIVKVLDGFTCMPCLNNLYTSVQLLSFFNCIMSEECKDMLLDPKLAPYFGCDIQPLQIQEQVPWQPTIFECGTCICYDRYYILDDGPKTCPHGKERVKLSTINPKYRIAVKELGGAFTAGPAMFMITDELDVKPSSTISGISHLNNLNISISDLEERVVDVGVKEALSLLKASLISKTALSDVFILKKPKQSAKVSSKRRLASGKDSSALEF